MAIEKSARVKLADVAAAAGVSPSAVSLAIRGEPGVSDETRERIIAAARRLGYRGLSRLAARPAKPVTLGLVIKAPQGDIPKANHFYAPVLAGIEEACRTRGVDLLFATMPVDERYHPLDVPRLVSERSCDGLIVIGAHLSVASAELLASGPPVILVDAYAENGEFDSVVSDNVGGARAGVEYLVGLGHREIAIAGSEPDAFPSIVQRRRGYDLAIAEAELRPHYADGPHAKPAEAAEAAMDYVRAHPEVTGVFCSNDDVAVALVRAAKDAGLAVPSDLSLLGYDDIDLVTFLSPPLTTLAVDKIGMGRMAVTALLHRLAYRDSAFAQVLIRPRLVVRESTAPRAGVVERALGG